jgi:hypothetical protein
MVDRTMEVKTWPLTAAPKGYSIARFLETENLDFSSYGPLPHLSKYDTMPGNPIILVGTDGNDYSVLDKVDPRIKELAVEGKIEGRRLEVVIQNDGSGILYPNYEMDVAVKEASKQTLEEAYGDGTKILTPENKYWILKQMGFKAAGKGKWKNHLFEEELEFDLETDSLFQLAFRIHKTGYQNAMAETNLGCGM